MAPHDLRRVIEEWRFEYETSLWDFKGRELMLNYFLGVSHLRQISVFYTHDWNVIFISWYFKRAALKDCLGKNKSYRFPNFKKLLIPVNLEPNEGYGNHFVCSMFGFGWRSFGPQLLIAWKTSDGRPNPEECGVYWGFHAWAVKCQLTSIKASLKSCGVL